MNRLVVTCFVISLYVVIALAITCRTGSEKLLTVTEEPSVWDVGADTEQSVCSWRLVAAADKIVVVKPADDVSARLVCQNFRVKYSFDKQERLCGVFWSSVSRLSVYFIPPSDNVSVHFNISYHSKIMDEYSSQTTFSVYPAVSVMWISSGMSSSQQTSSLPQVHWLLQTDNENCVQIEVLDRPAFRGLFHIHDGSNATFPELGLCSSAALISGSKNTMFIRRDQTINQTLSSPGFWLAFRSTTYCDGDIIHLTARSNFQNISSPLASETTQTYEHKIKCRWLIESSDGRDVINLVTVKTDLQFNYKCTKNDLAAFEVVSGQLIQRWCGQILTNLLSSQSAMLVVFLSDVSEVKSRFQLQYRSQKTVTCGNRYLNAPITGYRQTFASPGFPSYYPNSLNCEWYLQADSAYYGLRMEILFLDLERNHLGKCADFLTIYDGDSASSRMLATICKLNNSKLMFEGSQSGLLLTFYSNSNTTYPGFKIKYYSFPKSSNDFGCHTTLNASENPQNLFSPTYPHDYPNNLYCSWILQTKTADNIIVIDITDSELEPSLQNQQCSADYGLVFDGPDDTYPLLGRWCGDDKPSFRSRGQFLNLVFITNAIRRYRGFQIKYYTMKDYRFCPYKRVMKLGATNRVKYFNSPNYPNPYPSDIECKWLISAPNGSMAVKLVVMESELEKSRVCSFDAVIVYDGKDASAVKLGSFCGTSTPQFLSTQQHMFLRFFSDSSTSENGFKIMYQAVQITAHKENSSFTGLVTGCILGSLAVVAAVATVTVLIVRRRQQNHTQTRQRRRGSIVVNVNRTDSTVYFMSPVFVIDSTDQVDLGAPPPYPGLPNDSFQSDLTLSSYQNELPPPYSETAPDSTPYTTNTNITNTSPLTTNTMQQATVTVPHTTNTRPYTTNTMPHTTNTMPHTTNIMPHTTNTMPNIPEAVSNVGNTERHQDEADRSSSQSELFRDRRRQRYLKPNRNSTETSV